MRRDARAREDADADADADAKAPALVARPVPVPAFALASPHSPNRPATGLGLGLGMGSSASAPTPTPARAPATPAGVSALVDMGFDEALARFALAEARGDVAVAAASLAEAAERETLARRSIASIASTASTTSAAARPARAAPAPAPPSTAPATRNPFAASATRLASKADVVDTLSYVLRTILENPADQKYRQIKTTNATYRATAERAPGEAEAFLVDCGFRRTGDWISLRPDADLVLVRAALAALDAAKRTDAYARSMQALEFERIVRESKATASEEEAKRRAELARVVPAEPGLGEAGSTRVSVALGDSAAFHRRFMADDTLRDVVNWLGTVAGSVVAVRLRDGSWRLEDRTLATPRTLDVHAGATLQGLGLWPGCELVVVR